MGRTYVSNNASCFRLPNSSSQAPAALNSATMRLSLSGLTSMPGTNFARCLFLLK